MSGIKIQVTHPISELMMMREGGRRERRREEDSEREKKCTERDVKEGVRAEVGVAVTFT